MNKKSEKFCKKCKKNVPLKKGSFGIPMMFGILIAFLGFAPGVKNSEPKLVCSICKSRL